MNTKPTMLPDRDLDLHQMARQIMEEHHLPQTIHAYRRHTFSVEEIIIQLLEWRAESQTRVDSGPWQYTYDPVTVEPKTVMLAIVDAARIALGCHAWGCRTAVDPSEITFTDQHNRPLTKEMETQQ